MRLKYIQAFIDKKTGAAFHYFRRPGYPRVRLPGLPGSAEFMRAYEAALGASPIAPGAKRTRPGSVNAAIAGYYTSLQFRSLATATQANRRAILERFRAEHGEKPLALLPQKFLVAVLSKMGPFAARNWLKTLRGLLQYALQTELCTADPTQGIKLPRAKSDGIHTWTESEIAQFEAAHPIGTKPRLAFALLLYTAQRRGDVVGMGRQHVRDGILTVRQSKTGATLRIPVHPALRTILEATGSEHMTFLTTLVGKPFSVAGFGNWFRDQCDAAELPEHCSAHGLRKAACRRLAEAGCSANEIAAISGHATLREIERYTKAADQERMARSALARSTLENAERTRTVKNGDV